MKVTVNGVISRGVKSCAIDENGHLIMTLTDESTVDLGRVNGNGIADISFKETDSHGNNVYTITMDDGTTAEFKANRGEKGIQGIKGDTGDTGVSVTNYELISGSHAPGTYDTYRMTLSDGTTFDCKVWNGSNGEGSGDMMAAIYDSHGKNTDVFDYVDNAIASIPTPDVSGQINAHNESETAHNDIRTGKQDKITASGLLKADGSGGVTAATPGTDYQTPLTTEEAQTLGIDATPTSGSNNLVTSGGVYTALAKKADLGEDGKVTAEQVDAYSKENSISASTRTALSLAATATPDAALAEIARQLSDMPDWLNAPGAGTHNSIYRGKYLGDSVTTEQYAAINDGTFDDMYIGDYWTIGGVTYRIAAFDYYLRSGGTDMTTHHVTLVPDNNMYGYQMNDTNVTTGGYVGSKMYTTGLADAKATINNAFGSSHILTNTQYLCNAVSNGKPSGGSWYDSTVELMTEQNVYGGKVFGAGNDGSTVPALHTVEKSQYPLFAFRPDMISNRNWFWLRDVVSDEYFSYVDGNGVANYTSASTNGGVRPAFSIKA